MALRTNRVGKKNVAANLKAKVVTFAVIVVQMVRKAMKVGRKTKPSDAGTAVGILGDQKKLLSLAKQLYSCEASEGWLASCECRTNQRDTCPLLCEFS